MSKNDTDTSSGIAAGAENVGPRPERTWTTVGAKYTTPKRRPDVLRAIASLQWHEMDGGDLEPPAVPGLAIKGLHTPAESATCLPGRMERCCVVR